MSKNVFMVFAFHVFYWNYIWDGTSMKPVLKYFFQWIFATHITWHVNNGQCWTRFYASGLFPKLKLPWPWNGSQHVVFSPPPTDIVTCHALTLRKRPVNSVSWFHNPRLYIFLPTTQKTYFSWTHWLKNKMSSNWGWG